MKDGETQVNLEGEMGIRLSIIITTTLIGIFNFHALQSREK